MKPCHNIIDNCMPLVTSYAEVWIETAKLIVSQCICLVTSYAEVWIETTMVMAG